MKYALSWHGFSTRGRLRSFARSALFGKNHVTIQGDNYLLVVFPKAPAGGQESDLSTGWKPVPRKKAIASAILVCLSIAALFQSGCILNRQNPAATQPATAAPAKSEQPAYWLDKPAVAHIDSPSFDALWNACRDAAQADGFLIDRTDYREGLLTTLPLVSKPAWEPWKNDVVDPHELLQCTIGTLRRTIRFDIVRKPDGCFEATPKVLVERDSLVERRITSADQYQNVFAVDMGDINQQLERTGEQVPSEYYYSVGRDYSLEKQLGGSVNKFLAKPLPQP